MPKLKRSVVEARPSQLVPGQRVHVGGLKTAHEFLSELMSRCPDDRSVPDWRTIGKEVGLSVAGVRLVACLALLKCWNRMCERGLTASDVLPSNQYHHNHRDMWG